MDISQRIEKIKQYFVSFNVIAEDDASYVLIRVPNNWTIPEAKTLRDAYSVEIVPKEEGIYFLTEMKNGTDGLFDCVESVIKYNKNIEERKYLLTQKIQELSSLFATKELSALKTLRFVMDDDEQTDGVQEKKSKGRQKKSAQPQKVEKIEESEPQSAREDAGAEPEKVESDSEDSGLMALAKNLTGD